MITESSIEALMRDAQWNAARQALREHLILNPSEPKPHLLEGICSFRLGDYAAAEASFGRAGALDPTLVEAGVKQCQSLERLERYDEAVDLAKSLLAKGLGQPVLRQIVAAYGNRLEFGKTPLWPTFTRAEYAW